MWDQPTEPTLVGAPIGHPDGSFGMAGLWGNGGGSTMAPGPSGRTGGQQNQQTLQQQQQQGGGPKMDGSGVVPGSGWGGPSPLAPTAPGKQPPGTGAHSSWNSTPGNMNVASLKNGMMVAASANGWDHPGAAAAAAASAQGPVMPGAPGSAQAAAGGGWGAPSASTLPMSWNGGAANSQWETTNSSGGASSWSQIASKNVVQTAGRAKSGNYESNAAGWGSQPVDQGTPWCSLDSSNAKGKDWHGHGSGGAGHAGWEHKEDSSSTSSSWHHGGQQKEKNSANDGGAYWKQGSGGGGHRGSTGGQGQWQSDHHVTSGSGWDSLPPQSNRSWNNSEPVTPSNVWTGPPNDTCVDSSMVWNNPNPKKVAQPDKGTNFWGDPTLQTEIKRWKSCSDEQTCPSNAGLGLGSTVVGGPQAPPTPSNSGGSVAGGSVWKETPMAPQPQIQKSVSVGWSDPPGSATGGIKSADANSTMMWGDSNSAGTKSNTPAPSGWMSGGGGGGGDNTGWTATKPTSLNLPNKSTTNWSPTSNQTNSNNNVSILSSSSNNNNNSSSNMMMNTPNSSSSAAAASYMHQMPANKSATSSIALTQMELHHRSPTENDCSNDDVFSSNPTTPMNVKNGLNPANYQRMTQQLQQQQQQQQQQSGKILQNMQQAANNQQIQILTKQIADQLKSACAAGLIDASMLDNQLPQETLVRLNYLLQSIPKLEQAQRELHQLQRQNSPLNAAQNQEVQRLTNEVHQYQTMIQTMKAQISAQTAFFNKTRSSAINIGGPGVGTVQSGGNVAMSGAGGGQPTNRMTSSNDPVSPQSQLSNSGDSLNQSKLLQWKNANGSSAGDESEKKNNNNSLVTSPSASNLESLVQSMANASLVANENAIINDPWSNSKRNSAPDWPMSATKQTSDSTVTKNDDGLGDKSQSDSQTPQLASKEGSTNPEDQRGDGGIDFGLIGKGGSATGDEGPPEFRPGQKWLWKDPKEMAEDPNATPGSIKPSTLTLNTNLSSFNAAAAAAAVASHQFSVNHNLMNAGGLGGGGIGLAHHHSFSGTASNSLFGPAAAHGGGKLTDELKVKQSFAANADFYAAASRVNAGRAGGMPPNGQSNAANQMGQSPYGSRAPPAMIKQQFSVPNAFVPYNNFAQQWIVLTITNLSQIDEHSLQHLVNSYGTTQTYISPPGSGVAFVKFRDVPLERVLSKMQQEFTPLGVTIQMTKDSEVERLLQAFNTGAALRQPPTMFNTPQQAAAAHGLLGGPRHAAGMLWDAPPPAGPWATSNPPPPHPFGPPLGPLPDQMAQLMQQQQSLMHDSSVGGLMVPPDRHPF